MAAKPAGKEEANFSSSGSSWARSAGAGGAAVGGVGAWADGFTGLGSGDGAEAGVGSVWDCEPDSGREQAPKKGARKTEIRMNGLVRSTMDLSCPAAELDRRPVISYLDEMRISVQANVCAPEGCCPPDTDAQVPSLDSEGETELANLCRALGHPARVLILRVLLAKDVCMAGELVDLVPLAASTVSQHLKILKEAGLIKGEVDGPRRCYCADKSVVRKFQFLLGSLSAAERDAVRA